jgi:hypothetical protein
MYRVLIHRRYTNPNGYLESSCTSDRDSPITLDEALSYIGDNGRDADDYTKDNHNGATYFVVSEQEYQEYWKGVVT